MKRSNKQFQYGNKIVVTLIAILAAVAIGFYLLNFIRRDAVEQLAKRQKTMHNVQQQDELAKQIQLQKKLVHNAKKEIQEFRSIGLADDNSAVVDANARLKMAMISLNRLEYKQGGLAKGVAEDEVERIIAIIDLDNEALAGYRQEIEEYTRRGLSADDPKMLFAHQNIRQKEAEIAQYEQKLR